MANEIQNVILASGSLDNAQAAGDYNGVIQGCTVTKQAPGWFSVALENQNVRDLGKLVILTLQRGTTGDIACDIRWEDSSIPGQDFDIFFLFNGTLVDPPGGFSFQVQLVSDGDYQTAQSIPGDAGPDINTGIVDLYVDGVTGLDTNPGTAALPFLTLTPVANYIQNTPTPKHYVVHIVADGNYTIDPIVDRNWGALVRSINFVGEVLTVVDSGTATSGTINALTDNTKVWVADEHIDSFVEITSGPNIGHRKSIVANTVDTLTLATGVTAAILAGEAYRIIRPSAFLTTTTTAGVDKTIGGTDGENRQSQHASALQALRFVNLQFSASAASQNYRLHGCVEMYGCINTVNVLFANHIRCGTALTSNTRDLATPLGLANNSLYYGYGLVDLDRNVTLLSQGFVGFINCRALSFVGVGATPGVSGILCGGRIAVNANNTAALRLSQAFCSLATGNVNNVVNISPPSGSSPTGCTGIVAERNAAVSIDADTTINMGAGANGVGIEARTGAIIQLGTAAAGVTVTAPLVGARARFGGKIAVNGDGTNVTSAGDEFLCGEQAATVAASFAAVGNCLTGLSSDGTPTADGSVIQRIS